MITKDCSNSNQQNAHTADAVSLRRFALTWGPPLILMMMIFVFSAQPKTLPVGRSDGVYFSGVMPIFTEQSWETLVKKGSHMAGYGLLAVLMMRALLIQGRPAREAAHLAILLAVSYALTDELHQAFVPGRHASVLDIGFDYVGATSACLSARYLIGRQSKKRHPILPGPTNPHDTRVRD